MAETKEATFLSNLNDLASANPNQPATNGLVLLVRAEFKSELRSEIGSLRTEMNQRFSEVNQRFSEVNQRFDGVNQRFEVMDRKFDDLNQKLSGLSNSVELIAQQMATLLLKN